MVRMDALRREREEADDLRRTLLDKLKAATLSESEVLAFAILHAAAVIDDRLEDIEIAISNLEP